jgi:hypothetical protein
VTLLSAAGQTIAAIAQQVRDRVGGQTTGLQNLGVVKDSANQLANLLYDTSSNTIFVQAL